MTIFILKTFQANTTKALEKCNLTRGWWQSPENEEATEGQEISSATETTATTTPCSPCQVCKETTMCPSVQTIVSTTEATTAATTKTTSEATTPPEETTTTTLIATTTTTKTGTTAASTIGTTTTTTPCPRCPIYDEASSQETQNIEECSPGKLSQSGLQDSKIQLKFCHVL